MNFGGWMMLGISWLCICALVIYCYLRILGVTRSNIKAPLEIETHSD